MKDESNKRPFQFYGDHGLSVRIDMIYAGVEYMRKYKHDKYKQAFKDAYELAARTSPEDVKRLQRDHMDCVKELEEELRGK